MEMLDRTLIHNAGVVLTMDPENRVLENTSIVVEDEQIVHIGEVEDRSQFIKVIDATGKLVVPGLINTHHHTVQALLRGHPGIQNKPIEEWISLVSGVVGAMDADMAKNAAMVNMAELVKYGCTTTTDMVYMHPDDRGDFFSATVQAARQVGIRFHPYRGSMSQSEKDGALFPDNIVETSAKILKRTEQAIAQHHDPRPFSMTRVGIAPCNLYTSTEVDYREAADLAYAYSINMQTHASESAAEVVDSLDRYGLRPIAYLMDLGWIGTNTSFVHGIEVTEEEIEELASSRTSVVHCPISNARASLGEVGVAPISTILRRGVNVTLGTDGSAGNDSSNVREEMRWARTVQGVRPESTYLSPLAVMRMATTNAARMLNQPEIGSLEVGKAADIAIFPLDTIENAGSWDVLTGFVANQATPADTVMINGHVVYRRGVFNTFDLEKLLGDTTTNLATLKRM